VRLPLVLRSAAARAGWRLSRDGFGNPGGAVHHRSGQQRLGRGALEAARTALELDSNYVNLIQEGLRLFPVRPRLSDSGDGEDRTTSDFRDALFVGSTYGPQGVTVAVRIGFDDNRTLGDKETGGRAALPIFREIMLRTYQLKLVGAAPSFPREIEDGIDQYLLGKQSR